VIVEYYVILAFFTGIIERQRNDVIVQSRTV